MLVGDLGGVVDSSEISTAVGVWDVLPGVGEWIVKLGVGRGVTLGGGCFCGTMCSVFREIILVRDVLVILEKFFFVTGRRVPVSTVDVRFKL